MRRLPNTYPGDTTKYPNGRGTIGIGAADAGSKVLFYNETPVNLDLDFYNGDTDVLHAWEANFWTLDGEVSDITWAIDVDSLTVTNPPINAIFATIFNPHEQLNSKAYPMPLIRQIGGQQAIVSSASTVINDGNALLQVIEATLQGHASSDVIINNDGSYTLKGAGALGLAGALTHVLGRLTVEDVITANNGLSIFAPSAMGTGANANIEFLIRTPTDFTQGFVVFAGNSTQSANLFDIQNSVFASLFTVGPTGTITAPGAHVLGAVGNLFHVLGNLTVDGTSLHTGAATFTVDPQLTSKKIADGSGSNLIDWSAAGCFVKSNPATPGNFSYQRVGGTTDWALSAIGPAVTGSASATVNHLVKVGGVSTAPTDFWMNPSTAAGSQTFGFNTITSTQVAVVLGATNAYRFKGVI